MERIFQLLNEMEAQGLIQRYAIGGGMALMFYVEPILTEGVDIFVLLPNSSIIVLTQFMNFYESEATKCEGFM